MLKTVYVNNWNELTDEIKEYKDSQPAGQEIWYRGQNNCNYTLVPSLLRYQNGTEKELEIYETYRKFSNKLSFSRQYDWEMLVDMQHYSIPTRILDWSENLGIALFFAITNHGNNDAAIFLLNPHKLNILYSKKTEVPFVPDGTKDFSYENVYLHRKPFGAPYPIAIKTNFINDRVLAQRGMFTVHGYMPEGLEVLCEEAVKKIVISKDAIPEIKEFLEMANINEFTVFPDLHGLSIYFKTILI